MFLVVADALQDAHAGRLALFAMLYQYRWSVVTPHLFQHLLSVPTPTAVLAALSRWTAGLSSSVEEGTKHARAEARSVDLDP